MVNLFKKFIPLFLLTLIIGLFFLTLTTPQNILAQKSNSPEQNSNYTIITPKKAEGMEVFAFQYTGKSRTSDDVIENNLELKIQETFTIEKLKNSLQNLKNLQVFTKIDSFLYLNNEGKLIVQFDFDEKWTLLPYILTGSGGGTTYLVVGLYETNFIGRLYTFNFTYGCKNGNCSTFIFFKNPSVLGSPVNVVSYFTKEHNIFNVYSRSRDILGTFANKRDMINVHTDVKVNPIFSIGLGMLYLDNKISESGINATSSENNKTLNYQLPVSTSSLAFQTRLTLGKINYDGLRADGLSSVTVLDTTAQAYPENEDNYTAIHSTLLFYKSNFNLGIIPLPKNSVFAMRNNISVTSSDITSQHYFVGGLDKIRGFYDGEFSGKFSWFSNFELRIPSIVTEYFAIQHAIFADTGYAANSFPDIFNKYTGVSLGTGIRILPLKVNRVALRFDYAYTLNPFNTYGISFGLLQFF